jgi:hypothetical protein
LFLAAHIQLLLGQAVLALQEVLATDKLGIIVFLEALQPL